MKFNLRAMLILGAIGAVCMFTSDAQAGRFGCGGFHGGGGGGFRGGGGGGYRGGGGFSGGGFAGGYRPAPAARPVARPAQSFGGAVHGPYGGGAIANRGIGGAG